MRQSAQTSTMAKSCFWKMSLLLMMMMLAQGFLVPPSKPASSIVSGWRCQHSSQSTALKADGGVSMPDGGAVESCRRKIQDALQPVELVVSGYCHTSKLSVLLVTYVDILAFVTRCREPSIVLILSCPHTGTFASAGEIIKWWSKWKPYCLEGHLNSIWGKESCTKTAIGVQSHLGRAIRANSRSGWIDL